jgi:hypothetical protein
VKKRLIFLLLVALAGTAALSASAAQRVTLKALPAHIVYGQETVLRGTIPSGRAGQNVIVRAHACRFTSAVAIKTLKTKAGGKFSFRLGPTLKTVYSVASGKASSRPITVAVEPYVSLYAVGANTFRIDVSVGGGATLQGKKAQLKRLLHGKWATIGTATLKLVSSPTALTAVSSGQVNAKVPKGAQLVAVFPQTQASPCYRASSSSILRG